MRDMNWSAFEEYTHSVMETEHMVGVAVAVSQGGEVIYQNGFGLRDLATKDPVTPDTIFGIASVTKSVTALAIMKLADEGKLSVDHPVIKYLPEFRLRGVTDMSTIKIHHLLSHTGGVPPLRRREELNRLDEHLDYLATAEYDLLGEPGEYFSYCNDTFLLLGAIVEQLTGRLFRRYITDRVLSPLEMHRSTFSIEELHKFKNVSVPYDYDRKTKMFQRAAWPTLGNYEVGGGIRSNVQDLIKYGQLYTRHTDSDGQSLLPTARLREMQRPVHRIGRNEFYGYALRITPHYHNMTLIEHGGKQPGVAANFGFVPEEELVAVVLTNVSKTPVDDIWMAAINTALGLPLQEKRSIEPTYPLSSEQLRPFLGTYESAEGGRVRIYLEHNIPKAATDEEELTLARGDDKRTLVIEKYGKPLHFFFRDNSSRPWAMFHGLRMLRRVD